MYLIVFNGHMISSHIAGPCIEVNQNRFVADCVTSPNIVLLS